MSYIYDNNNPKDPFVNICTLMFSKWESNSFKYKPIFF